MNQTRQIIEISLRHFPDLEAIYLFGSYGTENVRDDSDVDIALLLAPDQAKAAASLMTHDLHLALEQALCKDVDLVNLRQVSTVLQKEVVAADRCIFEGNRFAREEFEMLTLSHYQKLNEERKAIVESGLAGRFLEL
jgi:uncharacterized protein